MIRWHPLLALAFALVSVASPADPCPASGLGLFPVPGTDNRAPASYLIYVDGQARAAVNVGPGSAIALTGENSVEALFLTDLHTKQTSDLPALVAHWQNTQHRPVTVYGPSGSRVMPSTTTFVRSLFDGTRGAFRYLGTVVNPLVREGFRLQAHDLSPRRKRLRPGTKELGPAPAIWHSGGMAVHAGTSGTANLPAVTFRMQTATQAVVVLDSARSLTDELTALVADANLVIVAIKGKSPNGPYLPAKTMAALLKGGRVQDVAIAEADEATATEFEKAFGGHVARLAARRCWSPGTTTER